MLLAAVTKQQALAIDDVLTWAEEASQTFQFNQELLQASMQHIEQGICVIDRRLDLVAWNSYYEKMFNYPNNYLRAGLNMRAILRFNAQRGLLGKQIDADQEIQKRLDFLTNGSRYKYRRHQPDGTAIEIQGSPMPGGGFVTSYTDITDLIHTQEALQQSKQELEQRVAERTQELRYANQALAQANLSKTRFLAAAGHDLMQPFNAATLYASMLAEQTKSTELANTSEGLQQALHSAEELLSALLDYSKLESGVLQPTMSTFPLNDVLGPLVAELSIVALQKGLQLRYVPNQNWVHSDKALLRRMLANLISNAIRYTNKGKVLIGVKRRQQHVLICVADTGIGIPSNKQKEIFQEFQQLASDQGKQGLGLGLAIVERMSDLLNIPVALNSTPGKGTIFYAQLPALAKPQVANSALTKTTTANNRSQDNSFHLKQKTVWIIDNDIQVLTAEAQLFTSWGAQVHTASDANTLLQQTAQQHPAPINTPDILLVDYHLDDGRTGIEAATTIMTQLQLTIPTILNSANPNDNIREQAIEAGFAFLHKPLKMISLKRLLRQLLAD